MFARAFRPAHGLAVLAVTAAVAVGIAVAPAAGLPALRPDGLVPPPAFGTPAEAADRAAVAAGFTAERIAQANRDRSQDPFLAFDPVLGTDFQYDALPETRRLLAAVQVAVGRVAMAAKGVFPRMRPYAVDESLARCPTGFLNAGRSYPSGHAAVGQAWGIVLAALLPSHGDALLARGRDYGMSRVVCGLHWPSDVAAGQAIGAAVAAQILGDPAFARRLRRAADELAPFG